MLELEQQGIKRALVDSQKVSADLLDAPGNSPAVLLSQDVECLENHQRERTLQDFRLFLHGESTFRFPTGIMARLLLENNRKVRTFYSRQIQKGRRPPRHCAGQVRDAASRIGRESVGGQRDRGVRRVEADLLSDQGWLRRGGDRRSGAQETGPTRPAQAAGRGVGVYRREPCSGRARSSAPIGHSDRGEIPSRRSPADDRAARPAGAEARRVFGLRRCRRIQNRHSCLRSNGDERRASRSNVMSDSLKVQPHHLERSAYLYIRQSSMRQVIENVESTKRQYALRSRAIALGWRDDQIVVIDSDQGESGASAAWREGFQRLVTDVGMGRAGIVMGLEVSRLARNNADWHRLLEICAFADTLILDEDGVYDPTNFNDRLLLGLKGTMSEAELHVLKARLRGGILNKVHRGEYRCLLPTG